jgi:hypothetical protein
MLRGRAADLLEPEVVCCVGSAPAPDAGFRVAVAGASGRTKCYYSAIGNLDDGNASETRIE